MIQMLFVLTVSLERAAYAMYCALTLVWVFRKICARRLAILLRIFLIRRIRNWHRQLFIRFLRITMLPVSQFSRSASAISVRKMELWQMQQFSMARIHKSLQEQVMDVLMPSAMRLRIILMLAMSLVSMRSILWQREVLQRQLHMLVLFAMEDVIGVLELTTISLRLQLRRWQLQ